MSETLLDFYTGETGPNLPVVIEMLLIQVKHHLLIYNSVFQNMTEIKLKKYYHI